MIDALEMQRSRATSVAGDLLARSPAGSITCIFAGGSLARGEVWAAELDGAIEVYSDVDLYVVVRDPAALAPVAAAARGAVSSDAHHAVFLRPPDIGVYTHDDLQAQPVRPGTVDLPVHHIMLHGDAGVPAGLARRDGGAMAADEALYLIENRAAELAMAGGEKGGPMARLDLVRALKARLDVHAAHSIVAGTFVPTLAERAGQMRSFPDTLDADAREDIADAYRTAAKVASWLSGREPAPETERATAALSRAWRALAPHVLRAGAGAGTGDLVALRCRAGDRRANAREAIRLRSRFALPLRSAVLAAPALAYISPVAALRVDALVRRLHAEGHLDARHFSAHERYIHRLTRRFGFSGASQEMRVHAMRRVIS